MRDARRVAVLGALVAALGLNVDNGGEAAPRAPAPQTMLVTSSVIEAFAQDGGDIAWTTGGGRCGSRLHIRRLGARRTVTIDGIACSEYDPSGPPGELVLANGRAIWKLTEHFSNQAYGISIRTAAFTDPRVVRLGCCDIEYDPETDALPSWALAGGGRLLVYHAYSGFYRHDRPGVVMRVLGQESRRLFETPLPRDVAVDRGRIALVRRELGPPPAASFKGVWSPDGKRVAFLRAEGRLEGNPFGEGGFAPGRPAEIAVMGADGTKVTVLTRDGRERSALGWSSDGTRLVYAYLDRETGGSRIAIANADGSDSHDIAAGSEPEWSPDGSAIAFETGGTVSVVNVDGTGLRELAQGRQPTWSPDGTEIAFVQTPSRGLFVMRSDGTGVREIAGRDYVRDPTWSRDGIAYAGIGGVYAINADGSGYRRLSGDEDGGTYFAPAWSPDGRWLLFSSDRDDHGNEGFSSEVYVIATQGRKALRALTAPRIESTTMGEVRSLRGSVLSSFRAGGVPSAVALSGRVAAVLGQVHTGSNRIALFDSTTGRSLGVVRVPRTTGGLAASDGWVIFSVGRRIQGIKVGTRVTRLLARTQDRPVGLSISGRRVAWAENSESGGRIRALLLPLARP